MGLSKARTRLKMPNVTKFVDDIRAAFGERAIVFIEGRENGEHVRWGKRAVPENAAAVTPIQDWLKK